MYSVDPSGGGIIQKKDVFVLGNLQLLSCHLSV